MYTYIYITTYALQSAETNFTKAQLQDLLSTLKVQFRKSASKKCNICKHHWLAPIMTLVAHKHQIKTCTHR